MIYIIANIIDKEGLSLVVLKGVCSGVERKEEEWMRELVLL